MTYVARRAAFAVALLSSSAAFADTLTAIAPPPGYVSASPLGINNAGWVTGTVISAISAAGSPQPGDGFLRAPDGTFTIFNAGFYTQGRAISNMNEVIGYSSSMSGAINQQLEFRRDPTTGTITYLTNPTGGAQLHGIAQGINDSGSVVGNYRTSSNHGFLLSGGTLTDISFTGHPNYSVNARGIDNAGTIVGFGNDPTASIPTQGFVRATDGTMTWITHPSAVSQTILEAINNNGIALGGYDDAMGNGHAFQYNLASGTFTDITVPGAVAVQTFGINDSGQYVIAGSDAGGNSIAYIFTPGGPSAPDGSSVFLPVDDGSAPDGTANFLINVTPGQTYYIDPAFATGFEYLSGANVDFASVTLPVGVAPGDVFALSLWNGSAYHYAGKITAGVAYNFSGPVDRFEIHGIPASAMVNANNPNFVTGLTFSGTGQFNGQQISLVPEPAAWALMIGGFGFAGLAARRRRRTAIA